MERTLFDRAIEYVLKNEGGYVWDPDDAGGPTNFGITQSTLSRHRGHPVSPADVKNLSLTEAKEIYFGGYWEPLGLGPVHAVAIATCILDTGVLYGVHIGATFAQRACNSLGESLVVDGQIGPRSIAALNSVDVKSFVKTYVANIHARIDSIIRAKPRNEKFRKGWENRADKLLSLA